MLCFKIILSISLLATTGMNSEINMALLAQTMPPQNVESQLVRMCSKRWFLYTMLRYLYDGSEFRKFILKLCLSKRMLLNMLDMYALAIIAEGGLMRYPEDIFTPDNILVLATSHSEFTKRFLQKVTADHKFYHVYFQHIAADLDPNVGFAPPSFIGPYITPINAVENVKRINFLLVKVNIKIGKIEKSRQQERSYYRHKCCHWVTPLLIFWIAYFIVFWPPEQCMYQFSCLELVRIFLIGGGSFSASVITLYGALATPCVSNYRNHREEMKECQRTKKKLKGLKFQ